MSTTCISTKPGCRMRRFHPFYGTFHAMGRKRDAPEHSVTYATQSMHKLLAGISQASHVLVQDSRTPSWIGTCSTKPT